MPTITVKDELIVTNPDALRNPHQCQPARSAEVIAKMALRKGKIDVCRGVKPRQAYVNSVVAVSSEIC